MCYYCFFSSYFCFFFSVIFDGSKFCRLKVIIFLFGIFLNCFSFFLFVFIYIIILFICFLSRFDYSFISSRNCERVYFVFEIQMVFYLFFVINGLLGVIDLIDGVEFLNLFSFFYFWFIKIGWIVVYFYFFYLLFSKWRFLMFICVGVY